MDEAAPTRERGSLVDVLISVDMEGVAGIATRQQTNPAGRDYPIARALMTAEANAAGAGGFDGGGTPGVVFTDGRGPMDNLLGEQLDPRADYVVGDPKPLDMVQEVTPQTGVVLLVGYHAGAADPGGVLAHTYSGVFGDVRLNGRSISEAELNGLMAADAGVPVGLVTGDDVICGAIEKAFPGVVTVPVKTALGRTAARSQHPEEARKAIRAGAARAVAGAASG